MWWETLNQCLSSFIEYTNYLESLSKHRFPGPRAALYWWLRICVEIVQNRAVLNSDTEAEALILWPHDAKSWLIGKDSDAGKDWRQKGWRVAEDEMVRQYHLLNGHEFEQTPGKCERQGSLACCSPWGCKELDTTEELNWTVKLLFVFLIIMSWIFICLLIIWQNN